MSQYDNNGARRLAVIQTTATMDTKPISCDGHNIHPSIPLWTQTTSIVCHDGHQYPMMDTTYSVVYHDGHQWMAMDINTADMSITLQHLSCPDHIHNISLVFIEQSYCYSRSRQCSFIRSLTWSCYSTFQITWNCLCYVNLTNKVVCVSNIFCVLYQYFLFVFLNYFKKSFFD